MQAIDYFFLTIMVLMNTALAASTKDHYNIKSTWIKILIMIPPVSLIYAVISAIIGTFVYFWEVLPKYFKS